MLRTSYDPDADGDVGGIKVPKMRLRGRKAAAKLTDPLAAG